MSNPYEPDQPRDPYGTPPPIPPSGGQDPYGTPPPIPPTYGAGQPPYGGAQPPYGAPPGFGGPQPPFGNAPQKSTDAVSIIGFVLSLTFCLSVVGAILGFIGLARTKNGQRKGRWAAIAASIIGVLGTLAFAAGIVGIVFLAKTVVTPGNASAGECINVDESTGSGSSDTSISLTKKDCSESHDAEVVYVGAAGADADTLQNGDGTAAVQVCQRLADSAYDAAFAGVYRVDLAFANPKNVDVSDRFICYATPTDGSKLAKSIEAIG